MIKHLIDGEPVAGKTVFETVNPANQQVLAEVAEGGAAEAAISSVARGVSPRKGGRPVRRS